MTKLIMRPMQIEPAGADAKLWEKLEPLLTDDDWYGEPKLDGWRFLLHFGGGLDRMYLTGRRKSSKTGQLSEKGLCAPYLTPPPKWMRKMAYTVLDGEIMPPDGATFGDLAGVMNVEPAKAAARILEIGQPEYHVFDCLFCDGDDVRSSEQEDRKRTGEDLVTRLWPESTPIYSLGASMEKLRLYDEEVARGGEGIILKKKSAPYGKDWIKVKRYHTLDAIVTVFTEANEGKTGKFKGLIGAIVVSVYKAGKLVEIGQISGMSDLDHKTITAHRKAYLGRVVEIKAQELAKDRLRHPRFGRMRPDALLKTCTWEKMQRDLTANKNTK